jgi:aromatic ring-opening dioxygenase LigB subunit
MFLSIHGTRYDLIHHFATIEKSVILQEAKVQWMSSHVSTNKHTINHSTFNARVLARLLLSSITDDFCITVINHIPLEYRNDGPLLLWIICNNIHRNNIAFVKSIKCRIRESTLSQFGTDVPKYIQHIKDNIRLITTSGDTATSGIPFRSTAALQGAAIQRSRGFVAYCLS